MTLGQGAGNGPTLRETALDAIERTPWVPARSQNRIRAMVEGRPDWVISRQRAWGAPIALYVHRASGEYLPDRAVNARSAERRVGTLHVIHCTSRCPPYYQHQQNTTHCP